MIGRAQRTSLSLLKYAIYLVLTADAVYYTSFEIVAAPHLFRNGVSWSEMIEAYPATIDSWSWLILLWLFELETYLIPRARIKGALKWGLHALRGACYALGFYALSGYVTSLQFAYDFVPYAIGDVCDLSGAGFSLLVDLPEYVSIDATNCRALGSDDLYRLPGRPILAEGETLAYAVGMAWSTLINVGAWLLVVLVLEADLRLERRGQLEGWVSRGSSSIKALLYCTLAATAIYWGFESGLRDLIDASLWIAAFVFLEWNLFGYNEEANPTLDAQPAGSLVPHSN